MQEHVHIVVVRDQIDGRGQCQKDRTGDGYDPFLYTDRLFGTVEWRERHAFF